MRAVPSETRVGLLESESSENDLDPLVQLRVAFDECHAEAKVNIGGSDVRFDVRVECRHKQAWNETTDEDDVLSRVAKAEKNGSSLRHQLVPSSWIVFGTVLAFRDVQVLAPGRGARHPRRVRRYGRGLARPE